MRVLVTGTSFSPSYGGPAVSVARLANQLAARGLEISLWSPDGSMPDALSAGGVDHLSGSLALVLTQMRRPDVIHDNGIWLPHNHEIARLAHRDGIARVVSPRGMLEPWALAHKRQKKRVAWMLYQRRDMRLASRLHAATGIEAARLEDLDLRVPVVTIPNGVDVPPPPLDLPSGREGRVALFLGRLYPVKGLPMLLQAWSTVRPAGWKLRIAGPDEAGHEAELRSMVSSMRLESVVEFVGQVSGDAKERLLSSATLLVAPSHSESFGMSIAEALARGVPVLTTTATPWSILSDVGCGWQVEPTTGGITNGLRSATREGEAALARMGARGREYVLRNLQWDQLAGRYIDLYEEALRDRLR